MAKGARASTTKANNARLKIRVFGPVETERTARLSAKVRALASQPKPTPKTKEDVAMDGEEGSAEPSKDTPETATKQAEEMDIDGEASKNSASKSKSGKGRVEKRRTSSRRASIVFPKYKDGKRVTRGGKK